MSTVAIDYIWQVISESERSDEIQLSDNEFLIRAAPTRLTKQQRVQSGAAIDATLPKPGNQAVPILESLFK